VPYTDFCPLGWAPKSYLFTKICHYLCPIGRVGTKVLYVH